MSRFANCNYQVLQIRSSYKQRLEQWRSTSLKLGIAKIPEQKLIVRCQQLCQRLFVVISILQLAEAAAIGRNRRDTPAISSQAIFLPMFVCCALYVPGTSVQLLMLGGITCAPSRLVYCCTEVGEGDQVYSEGGSPYTRHRAANSHWGQPPPTRHARQGCAQLDVHNLSPAEKLPNEQ